ncbi:hypothetical protein R3P38DRAFT_2888928 [Favolaschia claudopus]|uniref:Uncharacterized protein n=1 Tax=Favolaschia claudopus TaxID=2862362 RepID=A0AAW0CT13_9AGAR
MLGGMEVRGRRMSLLYHPSCLSPHPGFSLCFSSFPLQEPLQLPCFELMLTVEYAYSPGIDGISLAAVITLVGRFRGDGIVLLILWPRRCKAVAVVCFLSRLLQHRRSHQCPPPLAKWSRSCSLQHPTPLSPPMSATIRSCESRPQDASTPFAWSTSHLPTTRTPREGLLRSIRCYHFALAILYNSFPSETPGVSQITFEEPVRRLCHTL